MADQKIKPNTPRSNEQLAQAVRHPAPTLPPVDARVTLRRTEATLTGDHALWAAIRNRTDAIGFDQYDRFINRVLCKVSPDNEDEDEGRPVSGDATNITAEDIGSPSIKDRREDLLRVPSIYGVDAYNLLKLATQAFLLFETGVAVARPRNPDTGAPVGNPTDVVPGEEGRIGEQVTFDQIQRRLETYLSGPVSGGGRLPYLKRIVDALVGLDPERQTERLPYCFDLLRNRFKSPSLLELIWSFWTEQGMLVQTMNAVCLRFQNRRGPSERDPLANLEIDPLRPLNNIIWGFIQDEPYRLSIPRRAYEYDHHYGMKLEGKAAPKLRSADSRVKFIEAFHNLLYRAGLFYREDADTTVIADGFPLLNSLREVHLLLAEGAHNQFGDLPWTSRAEMLMMEWILARPEMREFLRGRAMVPYQERWMGQVDTMKKLQGWTDTSITHFRNLAVFGEQIILSVRYGDWIDINDQDFAKTWARYFRPEIQGYIHAYLSATGVDLSEDIVDARRAATRYAQPSTLLRERLARQDSLAELPPATISGTLSAGESDVPAISSPRRRALNPYRRD
ncbi:MAG TPA: hypothetical protein VHR27_20330 [Blastocatellia bacterium]|jgi:hypothetical protein|nr:hypothetical protein [Blastocatellia bacterium]